MGLMVASGERRIGKHLSTLNPSKKERQKGNRKGNGVAGKEK